MYIYIYRSFYLESIYAGASMQGPLSAALGRSLSVLSKQNEHIDDSRPDVKEQLSSEFSIPVFILGPPRIS